MFYYVLLFLIYVVVKILRQRGTCSCATKLNNKTVIVTGANTGIGFETAKDLARRGARVILACRNDERGTIARNKIVQATGNPNIIYKKLDLTSFKSIRAFAADILATETAIHILINNAGVVKVDNSLTEDNLPIETQINHFGPFLLVKLLLPLIKSSAPSRIINVSSKIHRCGWIDFDTIDKPATNWFRHSLVYFHGKFANVLFTKKLSRDLEGTGVTANCLHPGVVKSDLYRYQGSVIRFLTNLVFITAAQGAQTSIHLAVAPELETVTGKYFDNCLPKHPSSRTEDKKLQDKLWEFSEQVLNREMNVSNKEN